MVLPLLLGALGSSLAGAGVLGGLSPLIAGAIGSGLGGWAETGSLEKGLLTGLGSFAGGSLLGPMLGGGAGNAAGAAGTAGAAAAPVAGGFTPPVAGASGVAALPVKANLATIGSSAAPMNAVAPAGIKGLLGGAMDYMKSGQGIGSSIGATVGSAASSMLGSGDGKKKKKGTLMGEKEMPAMPVNVSMPPEGYNPSIQGEWDYGVGKIYSANDILAARDAATQTPSASPQSKTYLDYLKKGSVMGMAEGGIASLSGSAGGDNEKSVIADAISAIKGEVEQPEIPLAKFVQAYGEDALRELVDKVSSGDVDGTAQRSEGHLKGAGDGMDDRIPASIDGQQDVLLSDGEFVVPADVVSGLGNGSSDAGARELERMMERVRQSRTGKPDQPKQIAAGQVVPA